MKSMRDFFGSLFGKSQKPQLDDKLAKEAQRNEPQRKIAEIYDKGDVIGGRYEVHGILGKGGFGVVYLVYARDSGEVCEVCALKTFRDELLEDAAAREAFKKEALLWVKLDTHPFILTARWVEEIYGRLFVLMDYIAPDNKGCVNLDDHLARSGGPLDIDCTLKWAIQFCMGMEHASAHGIKCHRDIKPANILITQDGTLKITDFGLAAAAEMAWRGTAVQGGSLVTGDTEGGFRFSLLQAEGKVRCGTPGYMPPEVYRFEAADVRSDIYSFGLVLWQMAAGSTMPPFHVDVPFRGDKEKWAGEYMDAVYKRQMTERAPRVDSPLDLMIERCLSPDPALRYLHFGELRDDLAPIFLKRTGGTVEVPETDEQTAFFWSNKGGSFAALGQHEDAIACYDKALAIDPRCADAWYNKGNDLNDLGRREDAIACYDKVLAIDPRNALAWNGKGLSLANLGRREDAIACYDKALAIDPRNAYAWNNKGVSLDAMGRLEEAIACYDKALAIEPRGAIAWNNKGRSLDDLGRLEEAIVCYNKALAIDPRYAAAWNNKGNALFALGQLEEAIVCYEKALAIDPRSAVAWNNKGNALSNLDRREDAIAYYDKALAIDPRYAEAWFNKALAEEKIGKFGAAASSYRRFIELAPAEYEAQVAHARQRLKELK